MPREGTRSGRPGAWLTGTVVAAAIVLTGGCRGTPPALGPAGMAPVTATTINDWLGEVVPRRAHVYNLRWRYQTQQGKSAGRAAVRFAPPDSVRFDYRAPFGRSGAAMLVADSIVWSTSDEDDERFFSVAPLFWAALAIPRPPPPAARLFGLDSERLRSWRYVWHADTLTYVVTPARGMMQAELRQAGKILGRVEVKLQEGGMRPAESTMTFPTEAARVTFTITDVAQRDSLDAEIWKRP